MKQVMDNFSGASADYAMYRPGSPREIFDFIYSNVRHTSAAWDCGTGNGQVALELATHFKKVIGTDISSEQLRHAGQRPNISYQQERAEQTSIADNSVDLITVAQAIHWFDLDNFYKEVMRVARPGALVVAWTYSLLKLTPAVNAVVDHLYDNILGPYWDKERKLIDTGYSTIPFPFREIQAPEINIVKSYSMDQLLSYLRTWSGVRHYVEREGTDPTALITDDLRVAWGDAEVLEVRWPVHVRAGFTDSL